MSPKPIYPISSTLAGTTLTFSITLKLAYLYLYIYLGYIKGFYI